MIPLTLHIGTPKTASTSIQESLWLNRQGLEEMGQSFCFNLGQTNNIDLFLACLHHNEGGFGILENRGVVGQDARDQFRNDVVRRLRGNSLSVTPSSKTHSLIASSEHLWFLWSNVHFRNLKYILHSADASLARVVVYIRPQVELLYSALSTMVRDGFCVDDIEVARLQSHEFQYLHYHKQLAEWKVNFPDTELKVFLFNDHKKHILQHFYQTISCPSENFIEPPIMNESLSDSGISILAELNRRFLSGKTRPEVVKFLNENNCRSQLGKLIDQYCSGKPTPTMEIVESINNLYYDENLVLLNEYFPGRTANEMCPTVKTSLPSSTKKMMQDTASGVVDILLDCINSNLIR